MTIADKGKQKAIVEKKPSGGRAKQNKQEMSENTPYKC